MVTYTKYLFFLLLVLCCAVVHGQWTLGAEVSPGITWISNANNKINGSKSNFDFRMSVFGQKRITNRLSLTTGVAYTFNSGGEQLYDRGGNYLPNSSLSNELLNSTNFERIPQPQADGTKIRYGMNFLEVPVGLKYEFEPLGYLTFYLIGPRISLKFLGKSRGAILAPPNAFESPDGNSIKLDAIDVQDENIREDLVPLAISWAIGGGAQYYLNDNFSLQANIIYENYLTDLTKNNGYSSELVNDIWRKTPDNSRAVLRGFYLNLGIIFNYGNE